MDLETKNARPCCVPGCMDRHSVRFSIPADEHVRTIWLARINNAHLFEMHSLQHIRCCASHFNEVCFLEGGSRIRLRQHSLPTLHLQGFNLPSNNETSFAYPQQPQVELGITPEKLREALKSTSFTTASETESSPEWKVSTSSKQRVYTRARRRLVAQTDVGAVPDQLEEVARPSTSSMQSLDVGPSTSGIQSQRVSKEAVCIELAEPIPTVRESQLAKTKLLVNKLKVAQANLRRTRKGKLKLKDTLKSIEQDPTLLTSMAGMNKITLNFISSQFKNQPKKPKGRRFDLDDKVFALSLMKQSMKAYKTLRRVFALPSRKCLQTMLNKIPFSCGINDVVFQQLKRSVDRLKPLQRNCVLMFDEIALSTGLEYDTKTDSIAGFVDFGGEHRRPAFADHALVFMIKETTTQWKQPMCYCYTEGTVSTADLVRMIKEVVRNVRKTELNVIASVCDQGSTNVAAINSLLADTAGECERHHIENRYQGYCIDDDEIIHLYDCPHLMKGIRNGLLTKNLYFTQDGKEKVASWAHIVQAYKLDQKLGEYSLFDNLTDEHVMPEKVKKMSVRHCTQVFSRKVASAMKTRAIMSNDLPRDSEHYLDPRASDTSDLLLFFDQLFDSVNGRKVTDNTGNVGDRKAKKLRQAVSENTEHITFWRSAIAILNTMYFIDAATSKPRIIPSLKHWIFTLKSFLYLWNRMRDIGHETLATRSFNQDPLENFFSCVRGYAGANSKPTAASFLSTTKSLLVNNLVSSRSVGANCEDDGSLSYLDNLKSFLLVEVEAPDCPEIPPPVYSRGQETESVQPTEGHLDLAVSYVSGVLRKKLKKKIAQCTHCEASITTTATLPENALIELRERESEISMYPSHNFTAAVEFVTKQFMCSLPNYITSYNVKKRLLNVTDRNHGVLIPIFCREHHATDMEIFLGLVLDLTMQHYLRKINAILSGRDTRSQDDDPLTKLAFIKLGKTRKPQRKMPLE